MAKTFEIPNAVEDAVENALLADAARRFVTLELEMSGDFRPDMGTVTACMAAHHDMYLLAGVPCGCDEGTCPGVLGRLGKTAPPVKTRTQISGSWRTPR